MARFGGNEFTHFSVPLVFSGRYFILEPGEPPELTVVINHEGNPVFEILRNQPYENPITHCTVNPTGIVTVAENDGGVFLYKVRPGNETSIAFGRIRNGEFEVRISDRSIQAGGTTLKNNIFNGEMAGVLIGDDGNVRIGATLPPEIIEWLSE